MIVPCRQNLSLPVSNSISSINNQHVLENVYIHDMFAIKYIVQIYLSNVLSHLLTALLYTHTDIAYIQHVCTHCACMGACT